jgi:NAD+ diphosphatase
LDRVAHRRTDAAWLASAWPHARVIVVEKGRALIAENRLVFLPAAQAPDGDRLFLGIDGDGTAYFAVAAPLSAVTAADPPVAGADRARPYGLREIGHLLSDFEAGVMMTAVALANWHASHGYAPATGLTTVVRDGGWRRADERGSELWPRTDPAVIVLVHDGVNGPEGRCLLGRNVAWTRGVWGEIPRYSCLAGFVEPGESAEQTVVREVAEEVGAAVTGLHYIASQPWPYPGSLMLGFHALADPAAPLRPDPNEIADARWFSRTEIAAADAGDPAVGFGISMPSSIAHYLIMAWLRGG